MAKLALEISGTKTVVIPPSHPSLEPLRIKPTDPGLEGAIKRMAQEKKDQVLKQSIDHDIADAIDSAFAEPQHLQVDHQDVEEFRQQRIEEQRKKLAAEQVAQGLPCADDTTRFLRMRRLAYVKAKLRGVTLQDIETGWTLAAFAVDGRPYFYSKPYGFENGAAQRYLMVSHDRRIGYVMTSPSGTVVGVKVYDSDKRVMFCLGECKFASNDVWSPHTEGFNRLAKVRKELFALYVS